jgi:hypothetical protein
VLTVGAATEESLALAATAAEGTVLVAAEESTAAAEEATAAAEKATAAAEEAAGAAEAGCPLAEGAADTTLPVVTGAVPKIADLTSRYGEGIIDDVLQNGTRYVDNGNDGNINVFMQRPDSAGYIRVTLDPTSQRIISAGLNKVNDVVNGIANGRFVPIK